jgi:hypothetical protein
VLTACAPPAGSWRDTSSFVVTILSTESAPLTPAEYASLGASGTSFASLDGDSDGSISQAEFRAGFARVRVTLNAELRDASSRSLPSLGMAPRTAEEALHRSVYRVYDDPTPRIVNVSAEDADNADTVYGVGDIITVTFSHSTDRAETSGGKPFTDRIFSCARAEPEPPNRRPAGKEGLQTRPSFAARAARRVAVRLLTARAPPARSFEPSIGTDYSGEWLSDRLFEVTALDTVGGALLVCNHPGCTPQQQSNVSVVGVLRNRGGSSAPSTSRAHLSGVSGDGAPTLERFEVSDPDNADYVFSDDDALTITFDRTSDLGAVEARRARVDALFAFAVPLGDDYSGEWRDDSTFESPSSTRGTTCRSSTRPTSRSSGPRAWPTSRCWPPTCSSSTSPTRGSSRPASSGEQPDGRHAPCHLRPGQGAS